MSLATGVTPRQAALEVLVAVERGARSDRALDRVLSLGRLSEADRRLCTEIVYGTLRRQGSLDRALAPFCSRPWRHLDPPLRLASRMGAYQALYLDSVPAHAAVDATVGALAATRHRGAGLVNAVLRAWTRAGSPDGRAGDMAAQLDVPPWLTQRWRQRWGDAASAAWFSAALAPPVNALALHPRLISPAAALLRLHDAGIEAAPSPWAPNAVRLSGAPGAALAELAGAGTPRSEASQAVTSLLSPGGERGLDACAGRGGKAIQLAEAAVARRLLAIELHRGRARDCLAAATRARASEVLTVIADATALPAAGRFDRILVDAPCSGLGTLRRHPEVRWRVRPGDLAALAAGQRRIAAAAADALAPGGEMLYVTCSTEPEENEQVVEWLLEHRPGLTLLPLAPAAPLGELVGQDGMLRTYPQQPDLDGFFAARLSRG